MLSIHVCNSPSINRATKEREEVFGTILLHTWTGEGRACVMFGNVRKLAVLERPSTSFIDKFIESIFCSERKIVLINSLSVPILTVHEGETDKTEEQKDEFGLNKLDEQDFEQELVQVARTVTLKPLLKTSVLVATEENVVNVTASNILSKTTLAKLHAV